LGKGDLMGDHDMTRNDHLVGLSIAALGIIILFMFVVLSAD
jgi:hypothetical protein